MKNTAQIDWVLVDKIIAEHNSDPENVLMILQDISEVYNYVPPEVVPVLRDKLGIKESLIYSVATFYKTISLEPRGKFILNVCTGTACHVKGAERITRALEDKLAVPEGGTTEDGMFTLDSVRCVGCCASGPVVMVNQETHGNLDRSKAMDMVEDYRKKAS